MCAVVDTALADMVLNGSGLTIGIRAMLNTSVAMQNSDWGSTAVRDGATAAGGATLRCACGLPGLPCCQRTMGVFLFEAEFSYKLKTLRKIYDGCRVNQRAATAQ